MNNETISTLITFYYSAIRDHNRIYERILRALEQESMRSERVLNGLLERIARSGRTGARRTAAARSSTRTRQLGDPFYIPSLSPRTPRPLPPSPPTTIPPPPPTRPPSIQRPHSFIRRRTRPYLQTNRAPTQTVTMTPITTHTTQTFPSTFFNPVPIAPTSQQIENATTVSLYQDISTNQAICPITMEEFAPTDSVMQIRHCRHVFTEEGLLSWFETSPECPACRHDIRGNNISQNVNLSNLFNNLSNTLTDPSNNILSNLFAIDPSANQLTFSFNY